jgi:hypothetical protein
MIEAALGGPSFCFEAFGARARHCRQKKVESNKKPAALQRASVS